jgi:hypothetical protein
MLFYVSDRWHKFISVGKVLVYMRCEIWFTIFLDELTVIPTYFDEVYRKHPKGTFSRVKCKPSSASKAIDYSTVKLLAIGGVSRIMLYFVKKACQSFWAKATS